MELQLRLLLFLCSLKQWCGGFIAHHASANFCPVFHFADMHDIKQSRCMKLLILPPKLVSSFAVAAAEMIADIALGATCFINVGVALKAASSLVCMLPPGNDYCIEDLT